MSLRPLAGGPSLSQHPVHSPNIPSSGRFIPYRPPILHSHQATQSSRFSLRCRRQIYENMLAPGSQLYFRLIRLIVTFAFPTQFPLRLNFRLLASTCRSSIILLSSLGPGLLNEYDHFKSQVWYPHVIQYVYGSTLALYCVSFANATIMRWDLRWELKILRSSVALHPEDGQVTSLSLAKFKMLMLALALSANG